MIRLEMQCDRCSFAEAYSLSGHEDVAVFLAAKGWGGEWREEKYFDLCPSCSREDWDLEDATFPGDTWVCDAWAYRETYGCRIFEELRDGTTRAIHEVTLPDGTVVVPPIDPSDYTRKTVELWIEYGGMVPKGEDPGIFTRAFLEHRAEVFREDLDQMDRRIDAIVANTGKIYRPSIFQTLTEPDLTGFFAGEITMMFDPGAVPPPEVKILQAPKYLIRWDKPTLMFPNRIILTTPILPAPEPPYPPRSTITGPDLNPDSASG